MESDVFEKSFGEIIYSLAKLKNFLQFLSKNFSIDDSDD